MTSIDKQRARPQTQKSSSFVARLFGMTRAAHAKSAIKLKELTGKKSQGLEDLMREVFPGISRRL